jgi:hypothetical protein
VSAHPDVAVFGRNMNPPGPAQDGTLRRHVLARGPVAADQPLRRSGVETAGHRVLYHGVTRDESTDLEVSIRAGSVRTDDTHLQPAHRHEVGLEGQHLPGGFQQHADPLGPVDQPGSIDNAGRRHTESGSQLAADRGIDRSEAGKRRRSESQPPAVVLHPDQTGGAFLDDEPAGLRHSPGFQPGVGGAERRVSGKRKLLAAREDPNPVIGAGTCRRQQEGGFGQVGPVGKLLHLVACHALGVEDHGEWISTVGLTGEDVDLMEGAAARGWESHRCRVSPALAGTMRVCHTTSMAENKTQPSPVPVEEFLATVEHPGRRADSFELLELMRGVTGEEAVMWGSAIIGFGSYHYRYASGRQGDAAAVGFSPRKANLALYGLTYGPDADRLLAALGKHKTGAACLYVTRLQDVDRDVLAEMIRAGYQHVIAELDSS